MPENNESPLLGALRSTPEVPPHRSDLVIKALAEMNNQLDDIKLKLDINNEVGLELLERAKNRARPNNATQAWPVRNKPRSSW